MAAVLVLGLSASTKKANAQDGAFGEGKIAISVGYGFPNLGKSLMKVYEDEVGYDAYGLGPAHFKFEYGLSDKIGFGLTVNYVDFGAEFTHEGLDPITWAITTYQDKIGFSSISFLARMNIHFGTTEKLDPYWGVGAGYRTGTWKFESTEPGYSLGTYKTVIPFGFETTVGMRYYVVDPIALYIELGIAKSLLQAGITIGL